jgi:hypothetical protein
MGEIGLERIRLRRRSRGRRGRRLVVAGKERRFVPGHLAQDGVDLAADGLDALPDGDVIEIFRHDAGQWG